MEPLTFDDAFEKLIPGVVVSPEQRGLVRLTGPQRAWFLQNTITNDVESVGEGLWVASCFLDLKGKVLAHFRVGIGDEEIWLDVDPPGVEPLLDWFVRYRFRTKVEIERVERASWMVVGQAAKDLAAPGQFIAGGPTFGGVIGDVPIAVVLGISPPASNSLMQV